MTTFNEAKEVKINDSDRQALSTLARSQGWKAFRGIVEDYILQLTHNVAVGDAITKEKRYEELDRLSGFSYFWKKLSGLVDSPETHKTDKEIKEENEGQD